MNSDKTMSQILLEIVLFFREAYCFTIGGRRAVRLKEKQNWMCRNGSDIILSALVITHSEDDNSKQGNCK